MGAARVLISSQTVGAGGIADITFSSIPQTYTDLSLKISLRGVGINFPSIYMDINGVTTNRSLRWLQGSGSAANSYTFTTPDVGTANTTSQTASTFTNGEIYIPNYTGSNNKSFSVDGVTENNATASYTDLIAGLWSSTAAITTLKIYINGQNMAQYSSFSLYGISKS